MVFDKFGCGAGRACCYVANVAGPIPAHLLCRPLERVRNPANAVPFAIVSFFVEVVDMASMYAHACCTFVLANVSDLISSMRLSSPRLLRFLRRCIGEGSVRPAVRRSASERHPHPHRGG